MQSYIGQVFVRLLGLGLLLIVFAVTGFSQNMFRKMNDFDGDGKADFAVVRNEGNFQTGIFKVWYIWQSRDGFKAFRWGVNGDMLAPGDYDGDGKTDVAIWRAGSDQAYYWVNGSQSGTSVVAWGISTDKVVEP